MKIMFSFTLVISILKIKKLYINTFTIIHYRREKTRTIWLRSNGKKIHVSFKDFYVWYEIITFYFKYKEGNYKKDEKTSQNLINSKHFQSKREIF